MGENKVIHSALKLGIQPFETADHSQSAPNLFQFAVYK